MSPKLLEKTYNPVTVEDKWYQFWLERRLFHGRVESEQPAFTIVIPPPNVTGMLTMGHILNNTIQDLLIRWKKMKGFETLWIPGTDHAGIATQNKVESALSKEGLTRHTLGREKFLERVWQWREQFGGIILQQLRKLGAACDWERECFTMDENLSHAVRTVFVTLYERGLIYQGRRLINWCPQCHTALADEEVLACAEAGKLWNIAYPFADGSGEIVVATTRPETMLGDTAVAVHPDDSRYRHLIGKRVQLPLCNRSIPIIADEHADPEMGSGAVKITPAHDFNDFEVGLRHQLPLVSVIASDGTMNENAGVYRSLDRFEARRRILSDLQEIGLLRGTLDREIHIPRCYRSNDVIEPFLSEQWFVKMKPLAEPAIEVVRSGQIRFHPEHWRETYFHWMENIRDWCISRQIWWGHRIPAWYCENRHVTVAVHPPERCTTCSSGQLQQDEDVLDTWFSSWLWPFSTLGWPNKTRDLEKFFPTDTLVTGPDIIFFWVARMIMASLEFMGDIPFRDVYFTGMIRDLQGRKMSKSLGNSPDPLWLFNGATPNELGDFGKDEDTAKRGIPAYGADAVRMTMVYLTPRGGDIQFDHSLVELGQKFSNKLWNAARFVLMNLDDAEPLISVKDLRVEDLELADRWILSRMHKAIQVVNKGLAHFHFNEATHALYHFVWSEYCDWYLELLKLRLYDETQTRRRQVARSLATYVLDQIVRLLHPIMPFITEEIWQSLPEKFRDKDRIASLIAQPFPEAEQQWINLSIEKEMDLLQQVISAVRNIRGEMNVSPAQEAELMIKSTDASKTGVVAHHAMEIQKLAKVSKIEFSGDKPAQSASAIVEGMELYVPLSGLIDLDVEKSRLQKEIDRLRIQLDGLERKLSNQDFIARAPSQIVEKERQKKADFEHKLHKLLNNLEQLLTLEG